MLQRNFTCVKNEGGIDRLLFQCYNLKMNYPLYNSYKYSFLGVALLDFALSPIAAAMNALVLIAICKHKSLRTIPNCIIFSMALSDMITGLLTQPIKGNVMLNIFKCDPNCSLHVAALQLSYSLAIVSFLSLSLITLERYIAIFHPYKYQELSVDKSVIIRVIIGIWILAALVTGLSFLTPQMILQRLFAIAVFILSLVCSIPAHIRIVRVVKKIQRRVSDQHRAVRSGSGDTDDTMANSDHVMSKATRVSLSILIAMVLCYSQSGVFTALRFFGTANDFVRAFHDWTQTFVLLSSSINPLLYCFQMKDMRRKVYEILTDCKIFSLNADKTKPVTTSRARNFHSLERRSHGNRENQDGNLHSFDKVICGIRVSNG